jgi:hypothetical protein
MRFESRTFFVAKEEVGMPVAVEQNFRGATVEQYDQILEKMGLRQGGETPPGAISHWVAKTGDGMRVVDVWESKEEFERFAQEQIGPYSREVGIEEEPETTFYDVHNYLIRG